MYKILVTDPLAESALKLLSDAPDVTFETRYGLDEDALAQEIAPFNAVLVRSATRITRSVLEKAENLKVIGRAGSGVDNIDLETARGMGIKVLNTPGTNAPAVAELTIGYLFALARDIARADHLMKQGRWEKKAFKGIELNDRTLGIIGCGTIGKMVARKAHALGMHILVYNRSEVVMKDVPFQQVELATLLSRGDFVTLHLALSDSTRHLIGAEQLGMMKDRSYLINTSRGEIVDEAALLSWLTEHPSCGAALDVFCGEPDYNTALAALPNVLATPHIAASTDESQERVGIRIVDLTLEYLRSKYIFL
ncbi:MAG: 3-phosphoglycerate dehydrogenase [Calditrichaeota bacterium]|nr:MAG: 3-phosphoglycerate dehydrogenase [Calditrichota bacterium]